MITCCESWSFCCGCSCVLLGTRFAHCHTVLLTLAFCAPTTQVTRQLLGRRLKLAQTVRGKRCFLSAITPTLAALDGSPQGAMIRKHGAMLARKRRGGQITRWTRRSGNHATVMQLGVCACSRKILSSMNKRVEWDSSDERKARTPTIGNRSWARAITNNAHTTTTAAAQNKRTRGSLATTCRTRSASCTWRACPQTPQTHHRQACWGTSCWRWSTGTLAAPPSGS